MARIVIDHLASIHHMEMDIRQINVFIGEQAAGKSTLCKAVYFFRHFKELVLDYFYGIGQNGTDEKNYVKDLSARLKNSFIQLFGYSWGLPLNLSMVYYYTEENWIEVKLKEKEKKYISVRYSHNLMQHLKQLSGFSQDFYDSKRKISESSFLPMLENKSFYDNLEKTVFQILDDDMSTYYIPAGRGLLSLLCNQKTFLDYRELDLINRKFMQAIEVLQPKFADGTANVHLYYPADKRKFDVRKMSNEIIRGMKGEYFYQKGREYLQIENSDEQVAINFTSSGQQEVLWLYNQLYALMLKDEKAFVIIEEPEAHLYPILQKNILDFIIKYINLTGGSVVVTTHSPYILTETNNLYIMGRLGRNEKMRKEIEKIADKWLYIQEKKLNAYKLTYGLTGTDLQSLIDEETGELLAEKIDDISKEINETYTKLFYLEEGL